MEEAEAQAPRRKEQVVGAGPNGRHRPESGPLGSTVGKRRADSCGSQHWGRGNFQDEKYLSIFVGLKDRMEERKR